MSILLKMVIILGGEAPYFGILDLTLVLLALSVIVQYSTIKIKKYKNLEQ